MTRRNHITLLTAAAAAVVLSLLTACSEAALPLAEADGWPADGDRYLSIGIEVPVDAMPTRSNQGFADGSDEGDANVNNAVLCIFSTTSTDDIPASADLKFHSAYVLDSLASAAYTYLGDSRNTKAVVGVASVKDFLTPEPGTRYFAYVAVNRNGNFVHVGPRGCAGFILTGLAYDNLKTPTTSDPDGRGGNRFIPAGMPFSDFSQLIFLGWGGPYNITMTNAPMVTKGATATDFSDLQIVTLPEIDLTKVYTTRDAALADPATTVYVERMPAKITIQEDASHALDGTLKGTTSGITVDYDRDHIRWSTDIRNQTTYNVRQIPNIKTYAQYGACGMAADGTTPTRTRFLDTEKTGTYGTSQDLYRVFWSEDLNYDYGLCDAARGKTSGQSEDTNQGLEMGPNIWVIGINDDNFNFDFELNRSGYVMENTTNGEAMTQDKTTRVYVRIPIYVGTNSAGAKVREPFYTLSTDDQDRIYHVDTTHVASPNKLRDYLVGQIKGMTAYKYWVETVNGLTAGGDYFDLKIENGDSRAGSPAFSTVRLTVTLKDAVADQLVAAGKYADADAAKESFDNLHIGYALTTSIDISYYTKGFAYYTVYIRHFDDDETCAPVANVANYDLVYPATNQADREKKYMGRYGLVRNTWYTVTVNEVRHIGSPTVIPDNADDADDLKQDFLGVSINTTGWALRQHKESLYD